jgi:factor associated with neutral sphingomyelinase activation
MNEAIRALHPPRPSATRRRIRRSASQDIASGIASLSLGGGSPKQRSPSFHRASSTRSKNNPRFTELLLEHGEKQLSDWAVSASSSGDGLKNTEGRLHLCSRSIVFEPRHTSKGIVRIPFRYMNACPSLVENHLASESRDAGVIFGVSSGRHFVMKANNAIGPYVQIQQDTEFRFDFLHSSPSAVSSLAKMLYESEKISVRFDPNLEKGNGNVETVLSTPMGQSNILQQVLNPPTEMPLDPIHFLHVHEHPLSTQMKCSIKQPLLERVGVAMLTNHGIYFQPWNGSTGRSKAHTFWSIADMKAIARRYNGLKDVGLEIYLAQREGCEDKSMYTSVLLAFESTEIREGVVRIITSQRQKVPLPCFTDQSFVESALQQWQCGEIDNYSYLLILNAAAGRSFHDLSRYPVFPWVLSNYREDDETFGEETSYFDLNNPRNYRDLSKPIGALNEERFKEFQKRYDGMVQQQKLAQEQGHQLHHIHDKPFMYGTHYSSSGYVLFYLLRVMPEHMLCLQNGK